jgi:hypothetical protein
LKGVFEEEGWNSGRHQAVNDALNVFPESAEKFV